MNLLSKVHYIIKKEMAVNIMWGSVDALEMKIEVERKLNEFEDMLKMAFPDLNKSTDENIKEYTDGKIKAVNCQDIPCGEVYKSDEWKMFYELAKKDSGSAIYHALIVGFMNGVAWERKNNACH